MVSLIIPKSLSQLQKPKEEISMARKPHSLLRSKSTSSYLETNARYLQVAPAPLPQQLSIDSLIAKKKVRSSNAHELETIAELMQLAPITAADPKEVTANFALEQILEQHLEICSGKGYARPGITENADQWHEVDILGISNDAFRVLFPQLELVRLAKIHSIIVEDLQVKRAPFSLETGVEDIAESTEPTCQDLSDEELIELFKLSFKSADQTTGASPVGIYHVRSDEKIRSFLESRKRARDVMLAVSKGTMEQQCQQLQNLEYPSTLDLSSSGPVDDIQVNDFESPCLSQEQPVLSGGEASNLSVFTTPSKHEVPTQPHEQSKLRTFQFRQFLGEEIPKVTVPVDASYITKADTKRNPECSDTDLSFSLLHSAKHNGDEEFRASVILSHTVDHHAESPKQIDSNQTKPPAQTEDSSRFISHSFDILSTLDVIEQRDRLEAAAKSVTSKPPLCLNQCTDPKIPPINQNQETLTKTTFQYVNRDNNVIICDMNKQFLQKFSGIHMYQRMKLAFETALQRLDALVDERSTFNRPYLDFMSTAFIGHTLFYNLKPRLNEEYCIDCVAEIKERRLRLQNRKRDYDLFMSMLTNIKARAEKLHNIRSKSVCGFTATITTSTPIILPSILKDDEEQQQKPTKDGLDEKTEDYILKLMHLRQRREHVYDHFETMISEHNQTRSSAVELCMSAINSNKAQFEKLINPSLNRVTQFDGMAVLNDLYRSYTEHALRTDFTTEIIEQADRDPNHELYWCARQLLQLKNTSYRNYRKYTYPEYSPRRREAFENARNVLMANKTFQGASEYAAVFATIMRTVQDHLQYLILTPQLLTCLNEDFIPSISESLFANMVFQVDLDPNANEPSTNEKKEEKSLQKALQMLPGKGDSEKSRGSNGSICADIGRHDKRVDKDVFAGATHTVTVNPILNRAARQDTGNISHIPPNNTKRAPANAYEWIQRRYWQIQHSMEQSIIKRKEALIQKDAEEAERNANILMTKNFTYTPKASSQAEELYNQIFKFPTPGETNFMEVLSIYLTNCFILLYEVLFPHIQEILILNFSDLAFEQTNKKLRAHCHLTGVPREAVFADVVFGFQCQALEENQALFRIMQKQVEIMLFKVLYTYVTEDIYPQWSIFVLLLFHGADRDMRYISQSKALVSFSQTLKFSRFNEEYMDILRKTHQLNVTMAYSKLYEDAEQVSELSMYSFEGIKVPACNTGFTKDAPLTTQLNQALADTVLQNVSLLSEKRQGKNSLPHSILDDPKDDRQSASNPTENERVQASDTDTKSFNLFNTAETMMISVQRIQKITEIHDFIYSQPTEWYFTSRIIADILYLNKEAEVQFNLSEQRMREITALFNNVECVLSAVKNQRGLITGLVFSPSPTDIFSSLPMFIYDLLDFYSSYPVFSDNLFSDSTNNDRHSGARPFGAQYNISTTTDQFGTFEMDAIARLDNDEPLRRLLQDVITTDNSLSIRSGSDLIVAMGNNSTLPFGSVRKRTNKAKNLLRSFSRGKRERLSNGLESTWKGSRNKHSHIGSPRESRQRARSRILQYRHRNANPPTVPIRTSQVIPEGEVPFMDMTGKADFTTVANITFNIKTRNTTYAQKVASFFDSHGKVGTYMEARKCNRLHYQPPALLYRLANLAKHAALNLKNYLDMILAFLTRYVKESVRFAERFFNARELVPDAILSKSWQVENLLQRMQTRIKEYYKAARMSLHATFKDKQREERSRVRVNNGAQGGRLSVTEQTTEIAIAAPRKPLLSETTTEPNSVFSERLIDSTFPFQYEAELISQFLRSETLLTAFMADYNSGSAPPEIVLTKVTSSNNTTSIVAKILLAMYHLYDGFWCLTIMPTECFFGTLRLNLKHVIVKLRHIYETLFLVAASRIEDYMYLAFQIAQKCIQAMQASFNAAKFSTPIEIGVSFNLFRTFMRNVSSWALYFDAMHNVENYLSEIAYGSKIATVYANVLKYRVLSSRMLFANHGFLPQMGSSLHNVHQTVVSVTEQIENWVGAAAEVVFPRVAEMLSLTSQDKLNCSRYAIDFRQRFANSICKNLTLPPGIDTSHLSMNTPFQQLLYANIWSQSGLPFISKKSMQDARLLLQQNKTELRNGGHFQFFDRPTTIHPIHISTTFLEMEDLVKRLIELLQIMHQSNLDILGFNHSAEYNGLTNAELFDCLKKEGEFSNIDVLDLILLGDISDLKGLGTKSKESVDEARLVELLKKKLAYYSKLLKPGHVIPVKPSNIKTIISEITSSSQDIIESRLASLLPLMSLTCKLMLLSDDLTAQINDWLSRPLNTLSVQNIKSTIINAINIALSFLASVGSEIPISSIAHAIFETLSNHRQQFLILMAIKAGLENTQVGFSYDVTAYDSFQPYNHGTITLDAYLGIDSREPLSIAPYVKAMIASSSNQITDSVVAKKAIDMFAKYVEDLHFALNTYCVKTRCDKLILLQNHEIAMSVLCKYPSILFDSFLLPVFCDTMSEFSLLAEPDFLCTEFTKLSDASSYFIPAMRPTLRSNKLKGRIGLGKFLTTTNCTGFYTYKPVIAKSLNHDLHLPPLRLLKLTSAIRSLRKLRYAIIGGSEQDLLQAMNYYQSDLFTSFSSYNTDSIFDLEWYSFSSIISYRQMTTGTPFNKPVSCYHICKDETTNFIASQAKPHIEACLNNALIQTTDTALQIENASMLEALGFVQADLRAMDAQDRIDYVFKNRFAEYWSTLSDAFFCSSFYRDAFENNSAARHVHLEKTRHMDEELYTTENTIYLHAKNLKDLFRIRKLHQGAKAKPRPIKVPSAETICPFFSSYITPSINPLITRIGQFRLTIMRNLYEKQLWLEPVASHLCNLSILMQLLQLQARAFRGLAALNLCVSLNHSISGDFDNTNSVAMRVASDNLKAGLSKLFLYNPFVKFPPLPETFGQVMMDLITALRHVSVSHFNTSLSLNQLAIRKTSRQNLWTICSDIFNAQATIIETYSHICEFQLTHPLHTSSFGRQLLFSAIVEVALYESYYSPIFRPKVPSKVAELNAKRSDPLPFVAIPLPQRIIDALSTILACCGYIGYEFVVFKLLYPSGVYIYYIDGVLQRSRYAPRWNKEGSIPQSSNDKLVFTKGDVNYSLDIDPMQRMAAEKEAMEYIPFVTPLYFKYLHLIFTSTTIEFINHCLSLSFSYYVSHFATLLQTVFVNTNAKLSYRNELSYIIRGLPLRITVHSIRNLMHSIREGAIYNHKETLQSLEQFTALVDLLRTITKEHRELPFLNFDKTYSQLVLERAMNRLTRLHGLMDKPITTYCGDPASLHEIFQTILSDPTQHPPLCEVDIDSLCSSSSSDDEEDVLNTDENITTALDSLKNKLEQRLEQMAHSQMHYNMALCKVDRKFNHSLTRENNNIIGTEKSSPISRSMSLECFFTIDHLVNLTGFSSKTFEVAILLPYFSNARADHILDTLDELNQLLLLLRDHLYVNPDNTTVSLAKEVLISSKFLDTYSSMIICPAKELELYEGKLSESLQLLSKSFPFSSKGMALQASSVREVESVSSFFSEVFINGGFLGRLGCTPLDIDCSYALPAFRSLQSFRRLTELLLTTHFVIFVTPSLAGYSDPRVTNLLETKLPLHMAYSVMSISLASKFFCAAAVLQLLSIPMLIILRDLTSEMVLADLDARSKELVTLFGTISTVKLSGRLVLWDPSLVAAASNPPIYEMSPSLRKALAAIQIPISSPQIIMATDLDLNFSFSISNSNKSATRHISSLLTMISGYNSLPKLSLETLNTFLSTISSSRSKQQDIYHIVLAVLTSQCCSSHRLTLLLELAAAVIGPVLEQDLAQKDSLSSLKSLLGEDLWSPEILTRITPTLPAFKYLHTHDFRSYPVSKLSGISVISLGTDTSHSCNDDGSTDHTGCSARIIINVLISTCLPRITCPSWVELFYEQFYAANCRVMVPLNTKGWNVLTTLAYSVLNRTDNLIHGLYLGLTDFKRNAPSEVACFSPVEKICTHPVLTSGYDLMTDYYTMDLLILSLIRLLTDFQLASNVFALKALLDTCTINSKNGPILNNDLCVLRNNLSTVPIVSAIRVVYSLGDLQTCYNGDLILDTYCIYIVVIPEQYIPVTSDRYYQIHRILSSTRSPTTKIILLSNCRSIYSNYVTLGITTESPFAQPAGFSFPCGLLSQSHLLYEFVSSIKYNNIVENYNLSRELCANLDGTNISATMFEETLNSFVLTIDNRILCVNLAEILKSLLIPILYIPLDVYKLSSTLSMQSLSGIVTTYLYLLQMYSLIIAVPKLGSARACLYPHYNFECNMDFLMVLVLVTKTFPTAFAYLLGLLFSLAVTSAKIFLLCATDHLFNRDLLMLKSTEDPAALLARQHNKYLHEMLQIFMLEKNTKSQYEIALNKISSEFDQPLFESMQLLRQYFGSIVHALNSANTSSPMYNDPYLYPLPQFLSIYTSQGVAPDSYESILIITKLISTYKCSKPSSINLLQSLSFEMIQLPYPTDTLSDMKAINLPDSKYKTDIAVYSSILCHYQGLRREDSKGRTLAYYLSAFAYFCKPVCLISSLFYVQNLSIWRYAYPLIKHDCSTMVHNDYISTSSASYQYKSGANSNTQTNSLASHAYFQVTKIFLRDESDIRTFLFRHQHWFCLVEEGSQRLAIAFVRTIIIIEVASPEILVSGFLSSFAYHLLVQMPDSVGNVMSYKLVNVCPVLSVCLTAAWKQPVSESLNCLRCLYCPYAITDCFEALPYEVSQAEHLTSVHRVLLYLIHTDFGFSFSAEMSLHLCKRIMTLKAPYQSVVPFLQMLFQFYTIYLYSGKVHRYPSSLIESKDSDIKTIDLIFEYTCFHQFGLHEASTAAGKTPQHTIETILSDVIPMLSAEPFANSCLLTNILDSEPFMCPTFSKNCSLHVLAIHLNSIFIRNIFNRVIFHHAGSTFRREKFQARIRQATSSFSNENLLSMSTLQKKLPSFSFDNNELSGGNMVILFDKIVKEQLNQLTPPKIVENLLAIPYVSGLQIPISIITASYLSYDELVFTISRLTCSEVKVPMNSKKPSVSSIVIDLGGLCNLYPSVDAGIDQGVSQLGTRDRVLVGIRSAIGSILRLSPSSFIPSNARKDRTDTYILRSSVSYYSEESEFYVSQEASEAPSPSGYYLFDTSVHANEYSELSSRSGSISSALKSITVSTPQAIICSTIQDIHPSIYTFVGATGPSLCGSTEYNRVMLLAPLSLLLSTNTLYILLSLAEISPSNLGTWLPLELSELLSDFSNNTSVHLPTVPLLVSILATKLSIFIFDDLNLIRSRTSLSSELQRLCSLSVILNFQDYSHISTLERKLSAESFNLNFFYMSDTFGESLDASDSSEAMTLLNKSNVHLFDDSSKPIPLLPADLLNFTESATNSTNPSVIIARLRCSYLLRYMGKLFGPGYNLPQNILLAIFGSAGNTHSLTNRSITATSLTIRSQLESIRKTRPSLTKDSTRLLSERDDTNLTEDSPETSFEIIELDTELQTISRRILIYCEVIYRTLSTGAVREAPIIVHRQIGILPDKDSRKTRDLAILESEQDSILDLSHSCSELSSNSSQGLIRSSKEHNEYSEIPGLAKEFLEMLTRATAEFVILQHYIALELMISLATMISHKILLHYSKQQSNTQENLIVLETLHNHFMNLHSNSIMLNSRMVELDMAIIKENEITDSLISLDMEIKDTADNLLAQKKLLVPDLDAQLGDVFLELTSDLVAVEEAISALYHFIHIFSGREYDNSSPLVNELLGPLLGISNSSLQDLEFPMNVTLSWSMVMPNLAFILSTSFSPAALIYIADAAPSYCVLNTYLHTLGNAILIHAKAASSRSILLTDSNYMQYCNTSLSLALANTAIDVMKEKIKTSGMTLDALRKEKSQIEMQLQTLPDDSAMSLPRENLVILIKQRTEEELQFRRLLRLSAMYGSIISACTLFGFHNLSLFTTLLNMIFGKSNDVPLCRGCQAIDYDAFCHNCHNCYCFCRCKRNYRPNGTYTQNIMPIIPNLCADITKKEQLINLLAQIFGESFLTKSSIGYRITLGHTALLEYISCITLAQVPSRPPIYVSNNILHSAVADAISGTSRYTTIIMESGSKLVDDTKEFYEAFVKKLQDVLSTRTYGAIFLKIETINWKALDLIGALAHDLKMISAYGTILTVIDHDSYKFRFASPLSSYQFFVTWGPEIAEVFRQSSLRLNLSNLFFFSHAAFTGSHVQNLHTCIINPKAALRTHSLINSMNIHRENLAGSILSFYLPTYFTDLTALRLEQDGLMKQSDLGMRQFTTLYATIDENAVNSMSSSIQQQLTQQVQYVSSISSIEKKMYGLLRQREERTKGSDSIVSSSMQALLNFTNYLARLAIKYPAVNEFWGSFNYGNIQRLVENINTQENELLSGPFYKFLLYIVLPILARALPSQQYYLTSLTLLIIGELSERSTLPSTLTNWQAIVEARKSDIDELVSQVLNAVPTNTKSQVLHSAIIACLEIISRDNTVSAQLIDTITPILSGICPRCLPLASDYALLSLEFPNIPKGGQNTFLLFAHEPLATCSTLTRKILQSGKSVNILGTWLNDLRGGKQSDTLAWTSRLMELERNFYSNELARATVFKSSSESSQASSLSGITIAICLSIAAVEKFLTLIPGIPGKVVIIVWTEYADINPPRAISTLIKVLNANLIISCAHSRGDGTGTNSVTTYAPPLASLTRSFIYGQQIIQPPYTHHPLAWLNVALDITLDSLCPNIILPSTPIIYSRLERLSLLQTVCTEKIYPQNTIFESMLFLRNGVAGKLSIATILQYKHDDLQSLLDEEGLIFKQLISYVLEPLCLPEDALRIVLIHLFCLWLFAGYSKKDDPATLASKLAPLNLSKECVTYFNDYIQPREQFMCIMKSIGVFLTSSPVEWIRSNHALVWYHSNTILKHALFMDRVREVPSVNPWRPTVQPQSFAYPVTFKIEHLPPRNNQNHELYYHTIPYPPSDINPIDPGTASDDQSPKETENNSYNDSYKTSLLLFIPIKTVSLISSRG